MELIADAYERATRKDPQNEELLSHLFMSHVRNGDYKKQQQVAMALYKLKPKNPYYFWAVMSIVMQVNYCVLLYIYSKIYMYKIKCNLLEFIVGIFLRGLLENYSLT